MSSNIYIFHDYWSVKCDSHCTCVGEKLDKITKLCVLSQFHQNILSIYLVVRNICPEGGDGSTLSPLQSESIAYLCETFVFPMTAKA